MEGPYLCTAASDLQVESPTVVLGSFSPSFLELPQEVLVMVMRKHQRYFPVFAGKEVRSGAGGAGVVVAKGLCKTPALLLYVRQGQGGEAFALMPTS